MTEQSAKTELFKILKAGQGQFPAEGLQNAAQINQLDNILSDTDRYEENPLSPYYVNDARNERRGPESNMRQKLGGSYNQAFPDAVSVAPDKYGPSGSDMFPGQFEGLTRNYGQETYGDHVLNDPKELNAPFKLSASKDELFRILKAGGANADPSYMNYIANVAGPVGANNLMGKYYWKNRARMDYPTSGGLDPDVLDESLGQQVENGDLSQDEAQAMFNTASDLGAKRAQRRDAYEASPKGQLERNIMQTIPYDPKVYPNIAQYAMKGPADPYDLRKSAKKELFEFLKSDLKKTTGRRIKPTGEKITQSET